MGAVSTLPRSQDRPEPLDRLDLDDVPRVISCEIARLRLLQRLDERWRRPVTTVVAGAGFGKTIAVAQSVRQNKAHPRGVDVWIGCGPAERDHIRLAELLAQGLTAAVDGPAADGERPTDIVSAIEAAAPLHVCIVVDDVHELGAESRSTQLLAEIIQGLPANGHVVLLGRRLPNLPLARLRSQDRVMEIGEGDLAFRPAEIGELAGRLGQRPVGADALGGWPALVRLALAGEGGRPWEYLREELLGRLCPADQRALASLTYLGTGTSADVAEVADRPVDVEALALTLPLIDRVGDDRFRAHALWQETLDRVLPPEVVTELRRRSIDLLAGQGRLADAARCAIDGGLWEPLGRIVTELVGRTISITPIDLAASILEAVPERHRGGPGMLLLQAAVRFGVDPGDRLTDTLIDEATARFLAAGQNQAAVSTLALGVVAAQSRADMGRLITLAAQAEEIPGGTEHPIINVLLHGSRAVVAELGGDPEAALAELELVDLGRVPRPFAVSIHRFWMHCLIMAGRADEAAKLAARHLADSDCEQQRVMPLLARWHAGDPSGYATLSARPQHDPAQSARDDFLLQATRTIVASAGAEIVFDRFDPERFDNARDAALASIAAAAVAVVEHDEDKAGHLIDRQLQRFPLDDRLGERHLRRFGALGYVLNRELRRFWDRADFGPSHRRVRAVARALLDARDGRPVTENLEPPQIFCTLPLPMSVELACRLISGDDDRGVTLIDWLADIAPTGVREELLRFCSVDGDGDDAVTDGAARILGTVPLHPAGTVEIRVLGPLDVSLPGDLDRADDGAKLLRRRRVRELLAALVVRRTMTRDQIHGLLWPDFDLAKAQRNLRVTLSHLRKLLEPDSRPGWAGYNLRVDGDRVSLFPSPSMWVDLWAFEAKLDQAETAAGDGRCAQVAGLLAEAVGCWRGNPLDDLRGVPELDVVIEQTTRRYLEAVLRLGEIRLVEGDHARAAALAGRALTAQPHEERAHRLSLAAAIERAEPVAIGAAVSQVRATLADLGVGPDRATEVLLAEAGRRLVA